MFKVFKKKEEKIFTEEELVYFLENDGIQLTKEEIQKAMNGDEDLITGICFAYSRDKKNYPKALAWFRKGAAHNYSQSQYNIGVMYQKGWCVPQDYHLAMEWYLKAVNNDGYPTAQYNIGCLYQHGHGVPKSIQKATDWYTLAAAQGDPDAQLNLAWNYEHEKEIRDLQKAVNWYNKLAENGNEDARSRLKKLNKKGYYPI